MIPSYRLGREVSDGPVTRDELKLNLENRLKKLADREDLPVMSHEVASHAARAGNTITKKAARALNAEADNSDKYSALMDISRDRVKRHFDSSEIKKSGFLNFASFALDVVHTAYVHKDPSGSLTLAYDNCPSLDWEFNYRGIFPERVGGANVYDLAQGYDADINRFMDQNSLVMCYTPASWVNAWVN